MDMKTRRLSAKAMKLLALTRRIDVRRELILQPIASNLAAESSRIGLRPSIVRALHEGQEGPFVLGPTRAADPIFTETSPAGLAGPNVLGPTTSKAPIFSETSPLGLPDPSAPVGDGNKSPLVTALIPPDDTWAMLVWCGAGDFTVSRVVPATDVLMAMDPGLSVRGIYTDGAKNALYTSAGKPAAASDIGLIALGADPGTPKGRWMTIEIENRTPRSELVAVYLIGKNLRAPVRVEVVSPAEAVARSQGYVRPSR